MRSRRAPKGRAIADRTERARLRQLRGPITSLADAARQLGEAFGNITAAMAALVVQQDEAHGNWRRAVDLSKGAWDRDMAAVRADWDRLGEEWSDG